MPRLTPSERSLTIGQMQDDQGASDYRGSLELLQRDAGRRAMWNLSRKYFAALAAAILATVLAKPELVKASSLGDFVLWYLTLGLIGSFFAELRGAIEELTGAAIPQPWRFQLIFVVYVSAGVVLLFHLLQKILT